MSYHPHHHKYYVLDASAFYASIPFLSSDSTGDSSKNSSGTGNNKYYTTHAVLDEVKHIKSPYAAIQALLDSGNLQIIDPDQGSLEKASAAAIKTGDYRNLSQADISVIALALQLKTALVTDDYAAANAASVLGIPIKSALSAKGIKEIRRWISYCSACACTFSPNASYCPLCGNKLRRKYKKRSVI